MAWYGKVITVHLLPTEDIHKAVNVHYCLLRLTILG